MKLKTALKKRATTLAIWAMVVVLAAMAVTWLPHTGTETPPEVEFALLDGRKISLSTLRGRPVLVSFWATSCPPCVEELPDLLRLYRDLHLQGFELIAVAAPYDPPTRVQTFAADHALPYPVALDLDGKVARAFGGVPYIPAAFIIDLDGAVAYSQAGKLDITRARRIILKSLPQK
jgi:peroxiredoxin